MANWPFTRGVHDLGNGLYGYVQPDGGWGWSNAGLLVSQGQTLLVDTLMGLDLTREMLEAFRRVPGGGRIDRLFNTHANPDHFFGNGLVEGAEIIATTRCRDDMHEYDPKALAALRTNYMNMGDGGAFLFETMGKFDFGGVDALAFPTTLFDGQMTVTVGDKTVELIDMGPAHTSSDTIAWVPADRAIFTGDLVFNEGHPIMWAGPIENWIAACDRIVALDPEIVVPGHGPISDLASVKNMKAYFEYVRDEARRRFEAGMTCLEAARDINMTEYRNWKDPERIVANVFSLYRQWGVPFTPEESRDLFGAMGRFHWETKAHAEQCGHAH
ncbi:MBL fold metallo-hydrolase [Sphingomonas pokkalii]|uniref:MBL fold metallo-hydrolase n=1 Tax=Sphingomonas pokkalii TaxID=2175090 RepID=A0A2U0SFB7_9SPHN|nr:MBL fold metallo-hydrolase [Sphingomonas pokkalii]PVX30004.1 MBL fold metallo-hydrolase [Sphingomonas pokkalii]